MWLKKIRSNILYALEPAHTKPTFEWLTCTSRRYTFLYLFLMMCFINLLYLFVTSVFANSRLWTSAPIYRILFVSVISLCITCGLYILNLDTIQEKLTASLKWLLQKIRKLDPTIPWDKIVMKDLHCDDELQDIIVALNKKSSQIQEHIDYLEKLIWFIQHEFNTPLAITQLHLERLKKKWLDKDNEFEWIEEELAHMKSLVDALGWLIKTKTEHFEVEEVSFSKTINSVCERLEKLHPESSFDIEIQDEVIQKSNEQYIRAICRNICENALKHGSDTVKITLDKKQLTILDNWEWIDDDTIAKIRLPFWKKNPRIGKQEWFWLWLSLVKILVEKLNWKVDIKTNKNNGTAFIFTHTI